MKPNMRLYILLGILGVMILVWGYTQLSSNTGIPNNKRVSNARNISDINRNSGGLIAEKTYENNASVRRSWGADPFYYESPERSGGLFGGLIPDLPGINDELILKGIVWQNNVPTVLINNDVLKIGDEINGYRIVNVGQNYVTLRSNTERLQLTMGD